MTWGNPAAFIGLALVAGPLLVHLLVRRHAMRVRFPAMRFVPGVRAAAVRLRAPSDIGLLLLRTAVVAAAVLAAAQPLLDTAARRRAWQVRIARAVVIDTSASVPAEPAARLAEQATAGAFASHRFASPDLRDAVRRAAEWLTSAEAARREIAIVSDFQRGAIDPADFVGVPTEIGITPIRAGQPMAPIRTRPVDGWRGLSWDASVALDATSTAVTWSRGGAAASGHVTVRAAPADVTAAERALAAARAFGVSAAEPARRIEVVFPGASVVQDAPPTTPWIVSAALALRSSALIADAATDVQVGERDGAMIVKAALPAASPFAPAIVRASILAAAPPIVDPEGERASIDDGALSQWRRDATPIVPSRPWTDGSDGRWLWALALTLLGVETMIRRRTLDKEREVHADAA